MDEKVYRVPVVLWISASSESEAEDVTRNAVADIGAPLFPNFTIESIEEADYPGPPTLNTAFTIKGEGA